MRIFACLDQVCLASGLEAAQTHFAKCAAPVFDITDGLRVLALPQAVAKAKKVGGRPPTPGFETVKALLLELYPTDTPVSDIAKRVSVEVPEWALSQSNIAKSLRQIALRMGLYRPAVAMSPTSVADAASESFAAPHQLEPQPEMPAALAPPVPSDNPVIWQLASEYRPFFTGMHAMGLDLAEITRRANRQLPRDFERTEVKAILGHLGLAI